MLRMIYEKYFKLSTHQNTEGRKQAIGIEQQSDLLLPQIAKTGCRKS